MFISAAATLRFAQDDTGIGIARDDMETLFGEFNRVRPSGIVAGTDLGLAICKELAELLGVRIEVLSEVDEGTRFEVALPMPASGENVNPPEWDWQLCLVSFQIL
jgi:signal transduction histidine kinase